MKIIMSTKLKQGYTYLAVRVLVIILFWLSISFLIGALIQTSRELIKLTEVRPFIVVAFLISIICVGAYYFCENYAELAEKDLKSRYKKMTSVSAGWKIPDFLDGYNYWTARSLLIAKTEGKDRFYSRIKSLVIQHGDHQTTKAQKEIVAMFKIIEDRAAIKKKSYSEYESVPEVGVSLSHKSWNAMLNSSSRFESYLKVINPDEFLAKLPK